MVPRYVNHDTEQFWDITLEGNAFVTRFGAIGSPGEQSTKTWPDAARARAEHDKLIELKQARGFAPDDGTPVKRKRVEPAPATGPARNKKLEAQIARDLDDVDAFRVYGDWLIEHGDPRGELIALQTKKGHAKAAASWIEEHREHLLGDLYELSEETLQVTWRYGFIDSARLAKQQGGADADERTTAQQLAALLAHPSATFLRELTFGLATGVENGNVEYEDVFAVLGRVCPAHVRSIDVGDWTEWEVSWTNAGDVSPVWELPSLERLAIRAGSMALGKIDAPELRELSIVTGGLTAKAIRSIAAAKWPKLEKLVVYFGSSTYGATGGIADLAKLFSSPAPKKLTHLGLCNAEFADEICDAVAKSKLLRQLETLDLSKGVMSTTGVDALVKHAKAFAHLKLLDLGENCLSADDIARVRRLAKKVVTTKQKGEDARYVSLGE